MRIFGFRFHKRKYPWDDAPPWAHELRSMLALIIYKQEIAMTIAQDLEAEVAEQTTVIASVETIVQNLIDEIRSAGTDKVALEGVLTALQANKTRLGALAAARTAANPEAVASPAAPEVTG